MNATRDIPIVKIENDLTVNKKIELLLKREDLIHNIISGNKWWKLKYNLEQAVTLKKEYLLTFGGAYSNHVLATAAAGHANALQTIGIIRGEKVLPLNPTLQLASEKFNMQLHFVSRTTYRNQSPYDFIEDLKLPANSVYILPEGGTNLLAIKGCQEILNGIPDNTDVLICSCGTGGTLAGLICGLEGEKQVLGFSALKGDFLQNEVNGLVQNFAGINYQNWQINTDYHFGGYAKYSGQLVSFINHFKKTHGIALDPIYTGKMMYGLFDLIAMDFFNHGTRIVAIHSGGIQGIAGFNQRFGNILV